MNESKKREQSKINGASVNHFQQNPYSKYGWEFTKGAIAGGVEVATTGHILWKLKTWRQTQQKVRFSPQQFFTGIYTNLSVMTINTGTQVAVNEFIREQVFKVSKTDMTNSQILTGAFISGLISTIFATPNELLMTHQDIHYRNTGQRISAYQTSQELIEKYGVEVLARGCKGTGGREAFFTVNYLGISPIIKSRVYKHTNNKAAAEAAAAFGGGTIAHIASQPYDTAKTIQQSNLTEHLGLWKTTKKVIADHGVKGLYSGGFWRWSRICAATAVIPKALEKMGPSLGNRHP